MTTPLHDILAKRILAAGPITIADYMAECLLHPAHGYYSQEKVFGTEGDFITAPEVSQMFGEIIGLWLADRWYKMGKPETLHLIEFGPGRGTLMEDLLRATEPVEGFHQAVSVHFIEASGQLRTVQKDKVPSAHWHDDLSSVPDGPSLIIANEFFDALPIHQFEKLDDKWLERRVHFSDEAFSIVLTEASAKFALTMPNLHSSPNGSILEVCPAALSVTAAIAERLFAGGGAALIIDYGYRKSAAGDTLQALKAHQYHNPLEDAGTADITAHVAFDQIAAVAKSKGTTPYGCATQGPFLMALGIGERAQQLALIAEDDGQSQILNDLKRLTSPDEMGSLFKVLALQAPELAPPPGF